MPEMRAVFSSHVNQIGYDEDAGELHVHYSDGAEVVYADVPARVARDVLAAPSIGQALWNSVRGQFGHTYKTKAPKRGQG